MTHKVLNTPIPKLRFLRALTASTATGASNSSRSSLIHQQMAHNLEGGTYWTLLFLCVLHFLTSVVLGKVTFKSNALQYCITL